MPGPKPAKAAPRSGLVPQVPEALPSLPRLCEWCGRPVFRRSDQRTPDRDRPPRWCSPTCRNRFRFDEFGS